MVLVNLGGPGRNQTCDLRIIKPKFTKRYANLTEVAVKGIKEYISEVKSGAFPDDDPSYSVDEKEYEKFLGMVEKRKHI